MKKYCLTPAIIVFLIFYLNGIQAQTTQVQSNQIVIGETETIYSKILNEKRTIRVSVPISASSEVYTKQRYPVVYLLDGEATHFSSVVGMIRGLNSELVCPEMIVVGIPNTDRTRDLSPTHIDSFQFVDFFTDDNEFSKNTGGGEKFISFIEKELMPHIDSIYPTAPYRILFGHSLGGLTVMNTLVHHTNLFKAYVAVDPAMGWDNQKLLKEAKQALTNNTYSGISLFLAIANTMKNGMDTIKVKNDITKETEHIRCCFELKDYLNSNRQNQLNYKYKYYGNDNHHSVLMIAEYDALRFFFNCLHFHFFDFNDYKNIENQYKVLSKCFGYEVRLSASL